MADYRVIACEVFEQEILNGLHLPPEKCIFLAQGLHRTPDLLKTELQKQIDLLDEQGGVDCIYLGYGLCGNGVAGVCSRVSKLVIPDSEDCIPVLHGLSCAGGRQAVDRTMSYYLSAGWIAYGSDAWKEYQRCLAIFDHETAYWCTKEMIKHYRKFTLIDTGIPSYPEDQAYTRRISEFFSMEYGEVKGSLDWLESLFHGEAAYNVMVEPGTPLEVKMFTVGNSAARDRELPEAAETRGGGLEDEGVSRKIYSAK